MAYRPKGSMWQSSFGKQRAACNINTESFPFWGFALALYVLVVDWLGKRSSRLYKYISRFLPQPPEIIVCWGDYICVVRRQPLSGTTMGWGEQPNYVVHDRSADENTVALQTSDHGGGAGGTPTWAFVFWGFEACYCRTTGKLLRNSPYGYETSLTSHRAQNWNAEMRKTAKTTLGPHRNTISRQFISGKQISFADFYKKCM